MARRDPIVAAALRDPAGTVVVTIGMLLALVAPLVPFVTVRATHGMVCSADHLASGTGLAMLQLGGSAADAAVAASAVLAVTAPHMCGMGGDLFALVHTETGPPAALNASGRAGSGADPGRLRDEGWAAMPLRGDVRSVPVPGCVDGWLALLECHGRLPVATVLESARRYADQGFPASPLLAAAAPMVHDVAGAEDLVPSGGLAAGELVRRTGVARALADVARAGRRGFYEGEFGEGLLVLGQGEYTAEDLRLPQADWVDPLGLRLWGHDLWTVPPNSQGYLTLASAWIAEGLELPGDPDDPIWAHLLIEASRQAAWDRPQVLFEGADAAELVSPARLAPRRAAIDRRRPSPLPTPAAPGDTVFLCAVDDAGMGVSLIQSNAGGFGAHLAVPGLGILLQNRGIGFSLVPGHPAEYGPGRRPPHTLAPLLVTRPDGRLHSVIGTMGGDGQPQILLQLLARLLVAGQSPAPAIAAGRWTLAGTSEGPGFDTWDDPAKARVRVEGHAASSWGEGLRALGHVVEVSEPFSQAAGHASVILATGPSLAGAADPRALVGATAGY